MSNKTKLHELETNTCVQAGWFGRAVRKGDWGKAAAIAGGLAAGLGSLAQAEEVREYEGVADELLCASLMVDEIAAQVAGKAQTAALEAYGAFVAYLPDAHGRLTIAMADGDPGSRGGNTHDTMVMAAERAMGVLGLG